MLGVTGLEIKAKQLRKWCPFSFSLVWGEGTLWAQRSSRLLEITHTQQATEVRENRLNEFIFWLGK